MKYGHEIPIDATAGRVVARGEHFEYKATCKIYDSPYPMPTWVPEQNTFRDISGMKVGRLSVIGYSAEFSGKWVCRCACGMYCLRKAKALTSTTHPVLPCYQCYRLAVRKKSEYFKKTGKDCEISSFL